MQEHVQRRATELVKGSGAQVLCEAAKGAEVVYPGEKESWGVGGTILLCTTPSKEVVARCVLASSPK